jgi:hypothetical protein
MTLRRVIKTQSPGSGLVRYQIGPSKLYLEDLQMIHGVRLDVPEEVTAQGAGRTEADSTADVTGRLACAGSGQPARRC